MNDSFRRIPVDNSHIQGCKTQNCIYVARNGITDGSAGKQVQDDRQVDETVSDANIGVSRPGEFHPQPLAEPDMNLSAHPAPIIQPSGRNPLSNAQMLLAMLPPNAPKLSLPVVYARQDFYTCALTTVPENHSCASTPVASLTHRICRSSSSILSK